ncbi:MAG: arylesterase [Sideroxydans sp.]|jgi:lysophospholipase L1-like esterase
MRYLLLILVLTLAACGEVEKLPPLPSGSVVLALGDSLTAGAGVSPEQAWPTLLAASTGWQVINGGVNGNTSGDALKRLPALLEEYRPVLVLLTLGGNDMLRRLPPQEIEENLLRMIAISKAEGAQVVVVATPLPSLTGAVLRNLSAPEFYRQVAAAQQVPLIEDAIAEVLSDPLLKGDQIHPNAEGHAILAMKIFEALRHIGYAN